VVRGAQLAGRGRFSHAELVYVTDAKADRHPRNLAHPGDVIVTQRGTIGQVGLIPTDAPYSRYLLSQSQMKITVDPAVADREFLYFALRSPDATDALKRQAITAGVPHINLAMLRGFRVLVPPLAAQRRIAAVLSAFDELIEINERRIELLDYLARSLYREWFVRFRVPGHTAASNGSVPAGWGRSTLGNMATWFSGGTPSTKNPAYWDGGIPWITSGSLTSVLLSKSERTLTAAGVAAGSRLVERDTLLFVVRGMSLVREFRVGIADRSLAFGQDCKALIAVDGVDSLYLAFSVLDRQQDIQRMVELAGHGTGKLSTDRLKAIEMPLPPKAIQDEFAAVVNPIRDQISIASRTAQRVAATRDLLLHRLVTGRLDISGLDLGDL
jgi:type I restriction enzyme, S subunit